MSNIITSQIRADREYQQLLEQARQNFGAGAKINADNVGEGGSLRLGHATALTSHRDVIHYRVAASLPLKNL